MYLRLASILAALLVIAALVLTESIRLTPYWQAHQEITATSRAPSQFQPIDLGRATVRLRWASFPHSYLAYVPVGNSDTYHQTNSYNESRDEVVLDAEKYYVLSNLPEDATFAVKLSNKEDCLVLPLTKQPDGTSTTPMFIPLRGYDRTSKYFYGVRVYHVDEGYGSPMLGTIPKP